MIEAVEQETITTYDDFREVLDRKGINAGSNHTISESLEACNIDRFYGVYTRLPISDQEELEMVARMRLQVACEQIFGSENGIVVMRVNRGAGEWVASSLRELTSPEILSVLADSNSVWVMPAPGQENNLEQILIRWWRRGPPAHQPDPLGGK